MGSIVSVFDHSCKGVGHAIADFGTALTTPFQEGLGLIIRSFSHSMAKDTHGRLDSTALEVARRTWWVLAGTIISIVAVPFAFIGYTLTSIASMTRGTISLYAPKEPQPLPPALPKQLKVVTINIAGMPEFMTAVNKLPSLSTRIPKLIDEIMNHTDADVICIQEAFCRKTIHKLIDGCKDKYPFAIAEVAPRIFGLNSGLMVLSKFPLKNPKFTPYRNLHEDDQFANKGILSAEVQLTEDVFFTIITTHMQATHTEKARATRSEQIQDLFQVYSEVDKSSLTVLTCGDFNISHIDAISTEKGKKELFHRVNRDYTAPQCKFSSIWDHRRTPHTCWDESKFSSWQAISRWQVDHILAHQSLGQVFPLKEVQEERGLGKYSDHIGLSATLDLSSYKSS